MNLYSYVKNNPTTFGDPDGHCLADDACSNVTVSVSVKDEPTMKLNEPLGRDKSGAPTGPYFTGVSGTTSIKFTDKNGKNIVGMDVKEKNTKGSGSKTTENPEAQPTKKDGTITDIVGKGQTTVAPTMTKEDLGEATKALSTTPVTSTSVLAQREMEKRRSPLG